MVAHGYVALGRVAVCVRAGWIVHTKLVLGVREHVVHASGVLI